MKQEQNIENHILRELAKRGRGRIFYAQEFYGPFPDSSIRFSLAKMAEEGKIARLARGVFCYPELTEYGMKMMLPDAETIAQSIAAKSSVRIVPSGSQAAYMLGLTGLVLSRNTYLTDGAPRKIRLSNGRTIEFLHTSEMRIFAFRNEKMQLISNPLRALGKESIREPEREVLKMHLDSIPAADYLVDLNLCPEWVRDLLGELKVN